MANTIDIGGGVQLPRQTEKSNTPGRAKLDDAPDNYIVVNDSSLLDSEVEHSCVILFDWDTFIDRIIGAGEQSTLKEQYMAAVNDIIERLSFSAGSTNVEQTLNRAINKSLLDFRTNLSTILGNNTANFTLENFSDQWIVKLVDNPFYGQSIIQEGIRFTIEARGRFNDNTSNDRDFYRIFTGFVSGINEMDNPLDKKISFSASDISTLLSNSRYNISPAVHETDPIAKQKDVVIFKNVLQGKSIDQIFKSIFDKDTTDKIEIQRPFYWKIENGDTSPIGFSSDNLGIVNDPYRRNWFVKRSSSEVKSYRYDKTFTPKVLIWGHTGLAYAEFINDFKLFLSAFKTRQDVLTDLANITFFKCYTDGAGNVHFHPPRFEEEAYLQLTDGFTGTDTTKENLLTYTIFDDDTINQSYSQNASDVCTVARGHSEGGFGIYEGVRKTSDPNYLRSTIAWEDGISRFGFKEGNITTSAVGPSEKLLNIFTAAFLLRRNQERFKMSANVIMRPELQPDRPIYDYGKDKIYYIEGVTHSFSAGGPTSGGTYTTSINCSAGRRPTEKISSNIFATASSVDKKSFSSFIEDYASSYNLIDYRTLKGKTRSQR